MKLTSHQYGKARVRVLKILRDGPVHTLKELTVAVALEGDFETSYTIGDNSKVVATDTIKNTVGALAKDHLGTETERFLLFLGHNFIGKYPQVQKATVTASERLWDRLLIDESPHPHSFQSAQSATPFSKAIVTADTSALESGIDHLLILKSTASGFTSYPRCEFTTLAETTDRILATSLRATWQWTGEPADYTAANAAILTAMLRPFALNYSPSAQTTLFEMGTAALEACPDIGQIHIAMPNKHCLPLNLAPFGLENKNEIFVPTDEPHGQIEGTVTR